MQWDAIGPCPLRGMTRPRTLRLRRRRIARRGTHGDTQAAMERSVLPCSSRADTGNPERRAISTSCSTTTTERRAAREAVMTDANVVETGSGACRRNTGGGMWLSSLTIHPRMEQGTRPDGPAGRGGLDRRCLAACARSRHDAAQPTGMTCLRAVVSGAAEGLEATLRRPFRIFWWRGETCGRTAPCVSPCGARASAPSPRSRRGRPWTVMRARRRLRPGGVGSRGPCRLLSWRVCGTGAVVTAARP